MRHVCVMTTTPFLVFLVSLMLFEQGNLTNVHVLYRSIIFFANLKTGSRSIYELWLQIEFDYSTRSTSFKLVIFSRVNRQLLTA